MDKAGVRHLNQFASEEIKILLSLDPKPMKKSTFDEFSSLLNTFNGEHQEQLHTPIKHVNITFEQLIAAMEDIVDERDTEIVSVLDDFKKYCFDEGLILDGYKWMRAIVAGTTIKDNIELGLYYDQASRGYSEHGGAHETQTPGSTLSAVQIDIRERKFCIKPVSLGAYYVHEESSCSLRCVVVAIQL